MKKCPKCEIQHGKNGKFCSRKCANSKSWSEEDKIKKSEAIKLYNQKKGINVPNITCANIGCDNMFYRRPSKVREKNFCSRRCKSIHFNAINVSSLINCGRKSAYVQKNTRRSKNEIYFAELCKENFYILENEPMFNGWDSDIILPDLKIAVLWNGVWHYKKITEKHSVKQVQNRDKIKIMEIISAGYEPYIIKDMGKQNKKFVEEQFQIFLEYIKAKNA